MTNLDLLDKAVRQVKRDGPWEVVGWWAYRDGVEDNDVQLSVSSATIAAIREVYSKLQAC